MLVRNKGIRLRKRIGLTSKSEWVSVRFISYAGIVAALVCSVTVAMKQSHVNLLA
jgi:hypothetical protein